MAGSSGGSLWFTADTHYNHERIIDYCDRPFLSVEHMDDSLVESWNSVVKPMDTVFHLGDVTLGGFDVADRFFKSVNGRIGVMAYRWHHDRAWLDKAWYVSKQRIRVQVLHPLMIVPAHHCDVWTVLCHYPMARWDRSHYGSWHLHGHSHGEYQGNGLVLDVGVDNAYKLLGSYRPFSLDEVRQIMEGKNAHKTGDQDQAEEREAAD